MPSQTRSPGTIVSDSSFGDVAWTNPGNASVSDGNFATVDLGPVVTNSEYLKATNYGFSIPADATNIVVTVSPLRRASSADKITDGRVRLVVGGTIGTNDYSNAGNWPTVTTTHHYNLSAEAPSVAQINAADFGAAIAAAWVASSAPSAQIDHLPITISWDGSDVSPPPSGAVCGLA